ncbi:MAG: hypothetical protein ACO1OQ_14645 [Rufibacter sp.]
MQKILKTLPLKTLFFFSCLLLLVTSCKKMEKEDPDDETQEEEPAPVPQVKKAQFYADPTQFSRSAGREVTSITINGKSYVPKATVGSCSESFVLTATNPTESKYQVKYTMYMRNYNSLDAVMNNLPYTNEQYGGILYLDQFKGGCNTIAVKPGYGAQLFVLGLQ